MARSKSSIAIRNHLTNDPTKEELMIAHAEEIHTNAQANLDRLDLEKAK